MQGAGATIFLLNSVEDYVGSMTFPTSTRLTSKPGRSNCPPQMTFRKQIHTNCSLIYQNRALFRLAHETDDYLPDCESIIKEFCVVLPLWTRMNKQSMCILIVICFGIDKITVHPGHFHASRSSQRITTWLPSSLISGTISDYLKKNT